MATAKLYGLFNKSLANKEVDIDTDAWKIMLCTATYVPNQDTHQYKSSVTNELANGNGYVTGGATISPMTVTYDAATNRLYFQAAAAYIEWTGATWAAGSGPRYGVIYDNTPATDAARPLLGYVDFGAEQNPSNGAFRITWDTTVANAVGYLSVA